MKKTIAILLLLLGGCQSPPISHPPHVPALPPPPLPPTVMLLTPSVEIGPGWISVGMSNLWAADFPPAAASWAFFQRYTNPGWEVVAAYPYPTNGGTLMFTNVTTNWWVFIRAGIVP